MGRLVTMNAVPIKLVLIWLLFLIYSVVVCVHHRMFGQFVIFPIVILLRFFIPRPKKSRFEQRLEYGFAIALVLFLILFLIDRINPFPAWAVTAGEIVAWLVLIPAIVYGIYSDYVLYKNSRNTST